ncbi:hypothetical protein DXG01_001416 [Tephrocybe rancida]|nr:hypothetical protein DXG01_001416 [Tephrocybe rancida]
MPGTASTLDSRATTTNYLQCEVVQSPEGSDYDSDSDSNTSQATLEDTGVYAQFGHPLQRVLRVGSTNGEGHFEGLLPVSRSSSLASNSSWSSSSSVVYDIDYEKLIDDLLEENPTFDSESPDMVLIEPSSPEQRDSLMIKCLPRTSAELYLLLELNHSELRLDPWNPIPHLRCAVERKDDVYLCMERLHHYDQPSFKTVANYVDFFRQILEGLTFLHELKIANLSFQDPACYMVDLSSAPSTCESPADFDRTQYPVRYYVANLQHAAKFDTPAPAFARDIKECGAMIDRLLSHVPSIEPKIKSLVRAMTGGGFAAEDARKLFEAMCKSLKASTLESASLVPEQDENTPVLSIPKRSTPLVFLPPIPT